MNCKQPDRDVPGVTCGYPLPCPYHTVTIDLTTAAPTVTDPTTAKLKNRQRKRIRKIAKALAVPPADGVKGKEK